MFFDKQHEPDGNRATETHFAQSDDNDERHQAALAAQVIQARTEILPGRLPLFWSTSVYAYGQQNRQ